MKISANYDVREFVPKPIWDQWKENSTWFVNPRLVDLAEFLKGFLTDHYKRKLGPSVKSVAVVINNWHTGGTLQYCGFRPRSYNGGGELSQHRCANAFDAHIFIVHTDGKRVEIDYKEVQDLVIANTALFRSKGLTCMENVKHTPGWLHCDMRWRPNTVDILIVTP